MGMIFDTHAHYDDSAFDEDRDDLLSSMKQNGIGTIVDACSSVSSLDTVLDLIRDYPSVYGAVGIHPDYADEVTPQLLDQVRLLSGLDKVVAIGEIGLDYYWHKEEEEHRLQEKVFRAQMDIAREQNKAFMIHSREASADTLKIVKEYMAKGMRAGVMHCYSYSWETAQQYLDMGIYLGIGGVVTYKNARKLKEVVENAPLTSLVLETDCPYLAPVPYRGTRNTSLNLPYVVKEIASLKKTTEDEVICVTEQNARRLFGLKSEDSVNTDKAE